jgi:thiol-disulfide isomerase/thioredoxin
MKRHYAIVVLFLLVLIMPLTAVAQQADRLPIVQVVLFYSPTCPHCHEVMTTVLPPLAEQYGDQLQILGVDTTKEVGSALYQAAIEHFAVAAGRRGVPTLIAGTTVLVGGGEIPAQLPGLIEAGLAAGGLGWPEIPGLMEAMPDLPPSADPNLAADARAGNGRCPHHPTRTRIGRPDRLSQPGRNQRRQ